MKIDQINSSSYYENGYIPPQKDDPFRNLTIYEDFEKLIKDLDGKGTNFQQYHTQVSERIFFESFERIPATLKVDYLLIKDNSENTIIHEFAKHGQTEFIQLIFKNLTQGEIFKCLISQNNDGNTPVHRALLFNNYETAKSMLFNLEDETKRNECIVIKNLNGKTAHL